MFCIDTPCPGLAVVTFRGAPTEAAWPGYAVAYARLLRDAATTGPRLVVVFDLRDLVWDLTAVSQFAAKKTALTAAVKPWTLRALQASIVLTGSPALAAAVTAIVRAAGQSAPFFCVGSPQEVAGLVRRLVPLALDNLAAYDGPGVAPALWHDLGPEPAVGLLALQLARMAPGLLQTPPGPRR